MSRLTRTVPASRVMIERAAERGHNLGSVVAKLLELLDMYGAEAMEIAVAEVNASDRVGAPPVRIALEAHLRALGRTPPRPVLIANPRLRDISVAPVDLSIYDRLAEDHDAESP
jgi:hypothetical protein